MTDSELERCMRIISQDTQLSEMWNAHVKDCTSDPSPLILLAVFMLSLPKTASAKFLTVPQPTKECKWPVRHPRPAGLDVLAIKARYNGQVVIVDDKGAVIDTADSPGRLTKQDQGYLVDMRACEVVSIACSKPEASL